MSEPFNPNAAISIDTAASLLGITAERVRQLVKSGHVQKIGRGRVTVAGAVQGYCGFLRESAYAAARPASLQRSQDARAREIEQRIAMRDRQLIPIEDAIMALDKVVGVANAELSGLPARITRDMGIRKKAEAEVHGSRKRISKALAEMSGAAKTGVGLDDGGTDG